MKLKTGLMVLVGLLFYSLVDILIWQRIFEAKEMVAVGVGIYHVGYFFVLLGFVVIGALALLPHIRYSLAYGLSLMILAFSGWEDILYYWLDGRAIPALLPWLDKNPLIFLHPVSAPGLLICALVWLVIAGVLFYLMTRKTNSRS